MEELISKKEAKELMELEGETRGTTFKEDRDFILHKRGKEGWKKVEETLISLGYPMKFGDFHGWQFYPVGLEGLMLLMMKRILNFKDEEIEECGFYGSRSSFIIKIFFSHFVSIKMFADQGPVIWNKYYTKGALKVKDLDEEKKQAILVIEDFSLHPLHCLQLKGYFRGIVEMITGGEVICEETKCIFRGDEHHEFLIKY